MNKSNWQIFYSLAILLIVPGLLAFNTINLATNVRTDYDKELQSRAELANSVLAASITDEFLSVNSDDIIASKLEQITDSQNDLRNISVIVRDNSSYRVIASTGQNSAVSNNDNFQYDIVYSRKWPVAKNVNAFTDGGNKTRAWSVASPIFDADMEVIGIVSSDLLTTDVDEKFDATLTRSTIIMIVSSLAVIALLINHFKFIGYANLLQKQKELNQTMNDFLSVASHELKAPMSIIKGYISNVTDGDFGDIPQSAQEPLGMALSQTDRLNELVQDLLNVSRIEQGRIEYKIQPVNITEIIKTIVKSYEKSAQEKGLTINYHPETEENWVLTDPGKTQEIFINLIDNAVKYSVEGEIIISHRSNGKSIATSVRDTGIGMNSEERARLFQRFYRVKNDKTKEISGTGLGLWIIKQYIEKMGGDIKVDSLAGAGTEFTVRLKVSQPPQIASQNQS